MTSTTVLTEDLWTALDALDSVPEAQQTEWYKRLEEAADFAAEATEYANCEIESVSP